jgi:nitroreductase
MDFMNLVGTRRSIRWFEPDTPVEPRRIQRILEAARMTGCPGNVQPWRAVVIVQANLEPEDRERLLDAANRQRAHEQAPVWIYWFCDPAAAAPDQFMAQISLGLRLGALAESAGWDEGAARSAIEEGTPAPSGMPPLDQMFHGIPPEIGALLASREVIGACTIATLAAVNEGLGTCLHVPVAPAYADVLFEVLGVPSHFMPVWLQLVGYPAESLAAGGQRPRDPFEGLFAARRWGVPFPRDQSVVRELGDEGLLQAQAPLPGRAEELARLAARFGYASR